MEGILPEEKTILGIILRELEDTIIPDLRSSHAQTIAALMGQGIRNLIIRSDGLKALLIDSNETGESLLAAAGHASQSLPSEIVERSVAIGNTLEEAVVSHILADENHRLDDFCRQAITADHAHFNGRAELVNCVAAPRRRESRKNLMDVTPECLSAYLNENKFGKSSEVDVVGVKPLLSGFSKETFLIDLRIGSDAHSVVIRRNMPCSTTDTTVVDEYPLLVALYKAGLPVPEPLLLEADPSQLGEPFIIMRRAPGEVAASAMVTIGGDPGQRIAVLELAAFLGRLHSTAIDSLDLPVSIYDPAQSTRDYINAQIASCQRYYDNHRSQPSATIGAALAWLRENIPPCEDPPRLIHGDAWLANMLMADGKLSAMLDWELSVPCDPHLDLTYGRQWIEQIIDWDIFLAEYYKNGGPQYYEDRALFYTVLSDLKLVLYSVRTTDLLQKADQPSIAHLHSSQYYYGYFLSKLADSLLRT